MRVPSRSKRDHPESTHESISKKSTNNGSEVGSSSPQEDDVGVGGHFQAIASHNVRTISCLALAQNWLLSRITHLLHYYQVAEFTSHYNSAIVLV